MRHKLRFAVAAALAFGCIALFGLAISSADPNLFDGYYPVLLVLNLLLVVTLFGIVLAMGWQLLRRYQAGKFGSKLTVRLAVSTTVFAVVPTIVLYFISNAFITRSIESWFDVRVERALDSGVAITRNVLARQQADTEEEARRIAQALRNVPRELLMTELLQQVEHLQGADALVLTGNLTAVAAASGSKLDLILPSMPGHLQIQAAKNSGIYSTVDGDIFETGEQNPGAQLSIRVIVPIPHDSLASDTFGGGLWGGARSEPLYLQLIRPVESKITENASELLAGYRDYQELVLSRDSLRTIYGTTLTITLLLTAFGAIVAALSFAKSAAQPLAQLARGTRRVAEGVFQPIREFSGGDEINTLTSSFNTMIGQLSEAHQSLERQRRTAEQAQAYLEKVLATISSGVIVCDADLTLVTSNDAAHRMLGDSCCAVGSQLRDTEPALAEALLHERDKRRAGEAFSFEFELSRTPHNMPLFVRIAPMALGAQTGMVLVFDDITPIVEAQRSAAWGEVARRLAHEIKNPLTPIRLSAERLEWKLADKLSDPADVALLQRTTGTIVTQVDALKTMVDDFRQYAKIPDAKPRAVVFDEFLFDVVTLYHSAGMPVIFRPGALGCVVLIDAVQWKQVFHNLISNSVDAMANVEKPKLTIRTETLCRPGDQAPYAIRLLLTDNGSGFSEKILGHAFEPYITTKETGTGLGLPMVKKILDNHGASIQIANRTDGQSGAQVEIIVKILAEPRPSEAEREGERRDHNPDDALS